MRLMGRNQGSQLVRRESPRENGHDACTLNPAEAATIRLAPSFKPRQQEAIKWPDSFWDRFNTASSHYNQAHYQKAKEAYIAARSLLSGYAALDVALLRTYRKLDKAAIDKQRWDEAHRELCELFKTLPADVSDTDRKQFNKVLEVLKNTDADFSGQPLPLQKQAKTTRKKPAAQVESASGIGIAVERDDTWERPKGERPLRWQERQVMPKGFMPMYRVYAEPASGDGSCRIRTYSSEGEIASERDWAQSFYRLKMCPTGEYLIGYSDDLQMSLWTVNGDQLAERNIRREAEDNKYHVRCVDLSEDARYCLFTSTTRAYLLDQGLRTLRVWMMPPPEGYRVERGVLSADDYLRGFSACLGYPLSAAQWVEARRVAMEPDRAVLALARHAKLACPVRMFTNNPWLLQRHIAEVFPAVPDLFGTQAVFSAELGRSKPDPEAFRRLATRLECMPDEILYFDDDATYVAGAREAGLSAHRVGGAASVRAGLAVHGLQRW